MLKNNMRLWISKKKQKTKKQPKILVFYLSLLLWIRCTEPQYEMLQDLMKENNENWRNLIPSVQNI